MTLNQAIPQYGQNPGRCGALPEPALSGAYSQFRGQDRWPSPGYGGPQFPEIIGQRVLSGAADQYPLFFSPVGAQGHSGHQRHSQGRQDPGVLQSGHHHGPGGREAPDPGLRHASPEVAQTFQGFP